MEKALGLAIMKGGYEKPAKKLNDEFDIWENDYNAILLDPLFWISLGKAEGWPEQTYHHPDVDPNWRAYWHRLIDHIAEGKDIGSFFDEIIK